MTAGFMEYAEFTSQQADVLARQKEHERRLKANQDSALAALRKAGYECSALGETMVTVLDPVHRCGPKGMLVLDHYEECRLRTQEVSKFIDFRS